MPIITVTINTDTHRVMPIEPLFSDTDAENIDSIRFNVEVTLDKLYAEMLRCLQPYTGTLDELTTETERLDLYDV